MQCELAENHATLPSQDAQESQRKHDTYASRSTIARRLLRAAHPVVYTVHVPARTLGIVDPVERHVRCIAN